MSAVRAIAAVCAAAVLPACGLFRSASTTPTESQALVGHDGKLTEVGLQAEVARMTDSFMADVTQASNSLAEATDTPESRLAAQYWKTGQCASALAIATGPRAAANLLNMVVLATISRMVIERHWIPQYGAAAEPLLAVYKRYEEGSWAIAAVVMSDSEEELLHKALAEWQEENPSTEFTAFIRVPTFEEVVNETATQSATGRAGVVSSVMSLVSVDPFAGLDPTTREIERSRLFAERVFYYAKRAPIVISLQVELMAMELGVLPQVRAMIASAQSLSVTAEKIGDLAASLPEVVGTAREQAIAQISAVLDEQRRGIVSDLEKTGPELQSLLTESRTALEEANKLSESLQHLVRAVGGFIDEVDEPDAPDASTGEAPQPAAAPSMPSHPFDIREYGSTARDVTETARQLQSLVTALDGSVPELQRTLDEAAARAENLSDRLFWRALLLVLVAIAATAVAVVIVRRVRPARG